MLENTKLKQLLAAAQDWWSVKRLTFALQQPPQQDKATKLEVTIGLVEDRDCWTEALLIVDFVLTCTELQALQRQKALQDLGQGEASPLEARTCTHDVRGTLHAGPSHDDKIGANIPRIGGSS